MIMILFSRWINIAYIFDFRITKQIMKFDKWVSFESKATINFVFLGMCDWYSKYITPTW